MNTTPTPTGTEALVCQDIAARQQIGIAKYGTTVANNPLKLREWLEHAYQETLDQAIYLKRAIQELDRTTCSVTPGWTPHIPGDPNLILPPSENVAVRFRNLETSVNRADYFHWGKLPYAQSAEIIEWRLA